MPFSAARPITRRHALRQTFFYSAALALGSRTVPIEAEELSPTDHHFLMLGDFGSHGQNAAHTIEPQVESSAASEPAAAGAATPEPKIPWTPQQMPVAMAMQAYVQAARIRAEGLFMLGDNFYGPFPGGVNCPRWKTGFEDMYPADVFPGPCWAMLGNHDYDEDSGRKLAAEMEYAEAHPGTRWTMPAKWYRVDWPAKNPVITALILDSNYKNSYIYLTSEEKAKQLKWLTLQLARPRTAPWMVCMGHHPIYSNGMHGDNQGLIKDWAPLFQENNVACYFSGHDHDLQHLEFDGASTSFVISGGGGAHVTKLTKPRRGLFSQSVNGFSHLQVSPEKLTVRHIDPQGQVLHAFSRTPDGRVATS